MSDNSHDFGSHSDLCMYCDLGRGWFGRNEGKVCDERVRQEAIAKAKAAILKIKTFEETL